jgi:hypothetical protein
MPQLGRTHDTPSECLADTLMTQAHAEYRYSSPEFANDLNGPSGLAGRPGPGRDHDPLGRESLDVHKAQRIVAAHQHIRTKLRQVLVQVVRERVIVVDEQ